MRGIRTRPFFYFCSKILNVFLKPSEVFANKSNPPEIGLRKIPLVPYHNPNIKPFTPLLVDSITGLVKKPIAALGIDIRADLAPYPNPSTKFFGLSVRTSSSCSIA